MRRDRNNPKWNRRETGIWEGITNIGDANVGGER